MTAVRFSLDIAGAYPPEAKLKSWQRTISLQRGVQVEIEDRYEMSEEPGRLTLSLMTPCLVDASQPGGLLLRQAPLAGEMVSGAGRVGYDPAAFDVAVEELQLTDGRLQSAWGPRLFRLLFTAKKPLSVGSWKITVSKE